MRKRKSNGCTSSFYNGYFGDSFWPKKFVGHKKSIWRYSKNPRVRTYIFPSLAKQVLIFGGSYWQFRLKWVLNNGFLSFQ